MRKCKCNIEFQNNFDFTVINSNVFEESWNGFLIWLWDICKKNMIGKVLIDKNKVNKVNTRVINCTIKTEYRKNVYYNQNQLSQILIWENVH